MYAIYRWDVDESEEKEKLMVLAKKNLWKIYWGDRQDEMCFRKQIDGWTITIRTLQRPNYVIASFTRISKPLDLSGMKEITAES